MNIYKWLRPTDKITTVLQVSLPLGIYLGVTSGAEWYWWALSFFFYAIIYTMIGNNIAYHRYFTHKHFAVSKPVELFFLWAGGVTCIGDPIAYATTHMVHHKYSDTDLDPHGPAQGWKSILFYFYKEISPKETPIVGRRVVELLRDYGWVHNYYHLLILINAVVFWMIDYKVFLFCWLIPASLFLWGLGLAVFLQHWGFRPRNSAVDKWIPHYEGLHENHHKAPAAPNTAFTSGEIDWTYQFSRLFKPQYDWRGQPNAQHADSQNI